jgi:membrane protein involved in D-alanine export
MSALLFSETAIVALIYFILAIAVARLMKVGAARSIAFALINIAAVWVIFFGRTESGALTMLLYLAFMLVFWILLHRFGSVSGHLFLLAFLPPVVLLVFAKTTSLLTFVGLSYMTFRVAHITWELQLGRIRPMPLEDFMAHTFFMPTFLMGPISPYSYFHNSFNAGRNDTQQAVLECFLRVVKGFTKIIVVAGVFLQISPDNYLIDYRSHSLYEVPIAAIAFYIFLYANFSGLNDVSIAIAGLMGISVKENFDRPYLSQSCTEFWKRWHISLSEWMRDIVFLPLVAFLVRHAAWLTPNHAIAVALMTVFVLIGWWHGNGWQFWLIGFLFGVAIVTEHYAGRCAKRWPVIAHLALPPKAARLTRMFLTNLYVAMVVSLMSINWQYHDVTFAELLKRLGGVVAK